MTDADLLRQFLARESAWVALLRRLQRFHQEQLGRKVGPIHWMAGDTLGTHSWLGYYWPGERFWFGYGLQADAWTPLIEADRRFAASRSWATLHAEMRSTWEIENTEGYLRLWGLGSNAAPEQERWFLARSRELHEFAVAVAD